MMRPKEPMKEQLTYKMLISVEGNDVATGLKWNLLSNSVVLMPPPLKSIFSMEFLLERDDLSGPFNITAPEPVTSRGFCDAMRRHKRTLLAASVPAPGIRLLVGEMADELLLKGQRVLPANLQRAGFTFALPTLDQALEDILADQGR